MNLEAYTIYDIKAKTYEPPRFALNENTAKRMFIVLFQNVQSMYNKFPLDYQVFFIGNYNDETAEFNNLDKPTYKYTASDLIGSDDANQALLFQKNQVANTAQEKEERT